MQLPNGHRPISGWLERSFERAERSIASRPEHLRPRTYREQTAQEQPMRIELARYGRVFSTRDRGSRLLGEIEHELRGAESIVVDFRDVLSVSYSFADEFVGGLAQRAQAGMAAHVTVEHADGSIRDTIELSLRKRGIGACWAELAPA